MWDDGIEYQGLFITNKPLNLLDLTLLMFLHQCINRKRYEKQGSSVKDTKLIEEYYFCYYGSHNKSGLKQVQRVKSTVVDKTIFYASQKISTNVCFQTKDVIWYIGHHNHINRYYYLITLLSVHVFRINYKYMLIYSINGYESCLLFSDNHK